jgi:hypothetical protein
MTVEAVLTLDTHILIHAIDRDAGAKHEAA